MGTSIQRLFTGLGLACMIGAVSAPAEAQTVTTLDSIFSGAIATDADGNLFALDLSNNSVDEVLAAGGYATVKTIAAGKIQQGCGITLDAAGNIFVTDESSTPVKEIPAAGGYSSVNVIASANGNFDAPCGIAVDGSGNLFIADAGIPNDRLATGGVKEILAAGGYATITTLAPQTGQFLNPLGVAIDSDGNLFVSDTGNSQVKEILAAGGYGTVKQIAAANGAFAQPFQLTLDGNGNLFVANEEQTTNAVEEVLALGGYVAAIPLALNSGKFDGPHGVAVDRSGDVFVADTGNSVLKEIVATPSPLAAAVLPGARSVGSSDPATVFATMANASGSALTGCGAHFASGEVGMTFQTTDSSTNAPTGEPDQTVTIPANGLQTFVLTFSSHFAATVAPGVSPQFYCDKVSPAAVTFGVNTVDLTFSSPPTADVIALGAVSTNDGTLHLSGNVGAFAVATDNDGAAATLTASADTGFATLPLALALCQTDGSGQCLAPPAPSISVSFAANATPTFSVFATASESIPFNPGLSRIFVRFADSSGGAHGSTSVAVTTN